MILRMLSEQPGISEQDVRAALMPLDAGEYGGAPLLGVRGVSMICHGNSSPRAIKNAIKAAVRAVETGMNAQIGERLSVASGALAPALPPA